MSYAKYFYEVVWTTKSKTLAPEKKMKLGEIFGVETKFGINTHYIYNEKTGRYITNYKTKFLFVRKEGESEKDCIDKIVKYKESKLVGV